ncbi:hypothetical protein BASA81_003399 [Batrachochytrium salamandrivorans]|nr:hypothetical protein BASA81_003399 [Batrachochytrium salamandrivorans]
MGCASSSSSSQAKALPPYAASLPTKALEPSAPPGPSLSTLASSSSSKLLNPHHQFKIDQSLAKTMCTSWVSTFGIDQLNEPFSADDVLKDVSALLRTWPRGNGAGHLLERPVSSSSSIQSRGIKLSWLLAAWQHMNLATKHGLCSTRMFVELLVRPLLASTETDCLLDYVPIQFRGDSPHVFVSHAWDGMLKHVLFYPDNLKKHWPADCAVWLDVFAMEQLDDGPNPEFVDTVKDIVQAMSATVVVFPGDGMPEFALLPALRSWCLYEMHCTAKGQLQFRTGLHGDLNDAEFHNRILAFIDGLDPHQQLSSTYDSDDRAIRQAMGRSEDIEVAMKQWAKAAMAFRYETVPVTPQLARRLSSNVGLNRYSSLSDIYLGDTKRNSSSSRQSQPGF